ncbi:GntR family transcriptional regulator [Saccharothrix algeriensis]|uniref:GntR family transcriptional regulator n=1 Tax=Saccharothrix algeriensis TaxID=173560 RepID=A0A8T8I2P8_9PSEU|nr:GntR family transcriptional regulator [Saccharothrix algeriensis]MBM7810600.1 DNA-binding GntR family transcriptional regulator [Saccharothrix algeriensis]QTR04690.1 GntR family transcriptional regulator [Saccharothrix algeriensis]
MTPPLHLSLAGQAVDALRELVLTGEIRPGARVNEVELAGRLGISRGPLREAIRHLASEGLLVLVPHRGAHVPDATAADVRALFELRTALECAAAELAASRRTDEDVARLRAVCAESRRTYQAGERFPHRLDLAFHRALLDAARSPRIAEQVRLVQQRVVLLRSGLRDDPPHQHASLDEHDTLVDAVAAGEVPRAAEVMRGHLARVCAQMLANLG